jgi:PAS domain S-box-containing protein
MEGIEEFSNERQNQILQLLNIFHKTIEFQNSEEVIEEFTERSCLFLNASAATLVIWDSGIGVFNYTYNIPPEIGLKGKIITPDEDSLNSKIYRDKTSEELMNYSKNVYSYPLLKPLNFQYAMGTPLFIKDSVIGTLCFLYYDRNSKMDSEERAFLEHIGQLFSLILFQVQLTQKIEEKTQEYNQSHTFLELVLNTSPNIIILCDLAGKIKFWNTAAENVIGYSSNDMLNQKLPLLPGEEKKFHDLFQDVRQGVNHINEIIQFKVKRSEDEFKLLMYSIYPIRNQLTNIIESIIIMGQDISEKHTLLQELNEYHTVLSQKYLEISNFRSYIEELQSQLNFSERLAVIGDLSRKLSHQINNPMMIILNNLELIKEELDTITDEKIRNDIENYIKEIFSTANRIKNLMVSLKQFAESTKVEEVRPTDLLNVINQTIQEYKKKLAVNNIKVVNKILNPNVVYQIQGNFLQLKRVFRILVDNAILALNSPNRNDEEKILKISIENVEIDHKPYIRIIVRDNGCGIDPDELPNVFDPFYSNWEINEQSENPEEIHTGLGLPILRLVVQNHYGLVSVKSQPNVGTSFTLEFQRYTAK